MQYTDQGRNGGAKERDYMEERALASAHYIVEHGATVREAAKVFAISKSTVHKDVSQRLARYDAALALHVRGVLDKNKAERHIRGGVATKEKYLRGKHQSR